jgi:hypothetical protein
MPTLDASKDAHGPACRSLYIKQTTISIWSASFSDQKQTQPVGTAQARDKHMLAPVMPTSNLFSFS